MLAGGDVVAARGVHDDDTALGGGVGVDIFVAHAGAADDLQIGCRIDQLGGDLGAAADHPAVVDLADFFQFLRLEADFHIDFKAFGVVKNRQAFGCQGVGD